MGQAGRVAPGCGGPFEYRGTALGPRELARIQQLIDSHPADSQRFIAGLVCREFGWLRPNAQPPDASCSMFLRALAKRGAIRLPLRRVKLESRSADRDAAEILRALGTVPGFVESQPTGALTIRPIARAEWDGFRLHMERYHYLGLVKPAGESICYAAFIGEDLVALLMWSAPALHNRPRDLFIGWDFRTRERNLPWVVNNSRFLVLPWIRQYCLASRVLGANLRRLSRDWQTKYGHGVLLAETFVDRSRYRGTCYLASNWLEVGETRGWSRHRTGFTKHGVSKRVLLRPLHRRAVEHLRERDLPGELEIKRRAHKKSDRNPTSTTEETTDGLRHGGKSTRVCEQGGESRGEAGQAHRWSPGSQGSIGAHHDHLVLGNGQAAALDGAGRQDAQGAAVAQEDGAAP
jgi:hypothetical protein